MTTRDVFTAQDFAELRRHPVVAPMLAKLVWVTADGTTCLLLQGSNGIDADESNSGFSTGASAAFHLSVSPGATISALRAFSARWMVSTAASRASSFHR